MTGSEPKTGDPCQSQTIRRCAVLKRKLKLAFDAFVYISATYCGFLKDGSGCITQKGAKFKRWMPCSLVQLTSFSCPTGGAGRVNCLCG